MKQILIGLHGLARTGKDTAATPVDHFGPFDGAA